MRKILGAFICASGCVFFSLIAMPDICFSDTVTEEEAVSIADMVLLKEMDSDYVKKRLTSAEIDDRIENIDEKGVQYLTYDEEVTETPPEDGEFYAYVVSYDPAGYVIISADESASPVLALAPFAQFEWEGPGARFMQRQFGANVMTRKRLEAPGGALADWSQMRIKLQALSRTGFDQVSASNNVLPAAASGVGPYDTARWSQDWPYNERVEDVHNLTGMVTGCTPTAMAIQMQYYQWPPVGNSSHSYKDAIYLESFTPIYYHSANFSAHLYDWSNMPPEDITTSNQDIADLMYDCAVSAETNFEIGHGYGYPKAYNFNTFFRYRGTLTKENDHEVGLVISLDAGVPVIVATEEHTVLATGYRTDLGSTKLFYFNFGWGESGDRLMTLDDVPAGNTKTYPYSVPENWVYTNPLNSNPLLQNGDLRGPYTSLDDGWDDVPDGGTLWLKAGVLYSESVTLNGRNKFVTLKPYN